LQDVKSEDVKSGEANSSSSRGRMSMDNLLNH